MDDKHDLVSRLSKYDEIFLRNSLTCISPEDAKYGKQSSKLKDYLSAEAEWKVCAYVQKVLLETRLEFGKAKQKNLDEVDEALKKIDYLNISLLEEKVTKHDQLAVIEEIGRFVSPETKALLHPGTTSYDILDTARSYLFKGAWKDVIRKEVISSLKKMCDISERSIGVLQTGRTHLQDTSPVIFGGFIAGHAARMAERLKKCDYYFSDLRGKVSGIVGTGASIDMVIAEGNSVEFERTALEKLGLKPDYTATQIVQKERLADVGHGLTTLMLVLRDFANDIRILYSSAINEVTSRDNADRLGGSSADATKNNPINYENIRGKAKVVESGMPVLYDMIVSDLQRDLSGSVEARYQPQAMMTQTYESFSRLNKSLDNLSINEDVIARNLLKVRDNPSEAMVAILRGHGWIHPEYGVGHDFVKEMGKIAQKQKRNLLSVCMEDSEFSNLYSRLPENKREILNGKLENYIGSSKERANSNLEFTKDIIFDEE
jgi:adenylosuccinate lyase